MGSGRGVIALVLVVAIAAGIGGLVAGRYIESPEEAAASAEPPEASLITVPVELRELSSSVVVRGDVVFSDSSEIAPVVTGAGVVTRIAPAVGDVINEGDVLVELEGRPVFALAGDLPMFRNLEPGVTGDDVLQLEEALLRLGYIPGQVDGVYDELTEGALQVFYRDAGYDALGVGPDEQAQLEAADQQLQGAKDRLQEARDALADATKPVPESTRLAEAQAQSQTEAAVTDAKNARTEDNRQAADAVTAAETGFNDAVTDRDAAQAALTRATEAGPDDPDTIAQLTDALALAQDDVNDAQAVLNDARVQATSTATAGDAAVNAAEDNLAIHNATVRETNAERANVTSFQRAVTDAEEELATEQAAWDTLNAQIGTIVPQAEVIFLEGLPRRVQRVLVERGDSVTGSIMVVSGTEVRVESSIATVDRPLVNEGDIAVVSDTGLGIEFEAEITFLADSPGGSVDSSRYAMRLIPVGDVPEGATDNNLKVTIPFSTSGGEVLAVPLAALSATGDERVQVEVERSPGDTVIIEVQTGLRTGDFVEVTPLNGDLAEGDQVVVGQS